MSYNSYMHMMSCAFAQMMLYKCTCMHANIPIALASQLSNNHLSIYVIKFSTPNLSTRVIRTE
jgi:hypothetical protein